MPLPKKAPAAPAASGGSVDFLSPESQIYVGGFTLPEGRYAVLFNTKLNQPKDGAKFKLPRLGVELTCSPIEEDGSRTGADMTQFLSMGTYAHKAFMPSEDGKGLEAIPGGAGTLTNKSNWALFRDSLLSAGVDPGILSGDFSVLDGIWVETGQEAEPEERKSFKRNAATGDETEAAEAGADENRTDENRTGGKIPVVVAIVEGGKPWEGGGGIPEGRVAAPAKVAPKAAVKPVAGKVAPKVAPKPAPKPAAPAADEGDPSEAAMAAAGEVLGQARYEKSIPRLVFKTQVLTYVKENFGAEMEEAVKDAYFASDEGLAELLTACDRQLVGTAIKPV